VNQPIKAFVFDFDGTLADSMLMVLPVYNSVATGLGLPRISESDIPALRRLGPMKAIEAYGVPLWKVPLILAQVRRGLERQGLVPVLFPGLQSVFDSPVMKRVSLLILSSNSRANIARFLEQHPLGQFDHIDCGASLFGKARRLRRLLQVRHLAPSEVAYVGDEVRDVEAAREVGVTSIAVSWGYAERAALTALEPSYLVNEPLELEVLFRKLAGT
jgi:phosphoglycolate phosphatase